MKALFKILILTLISFQAMAQELDLINQISFDDIDTTVKQKPLKILTASRSQKLISDMPLTSYVITKEKIRENNYRTLVDVLKDLPGFRVSQPGDEKLGETFTYNGLLGNYYSKILINGIPITPSGAPGMPLGSQLPITQAERIEIITDPSSAVYGSDALGGVINIITEQNQKRANYGEAIFTVGSFGQNEANLLIGGQIGRDKNILKYNLVANHSEVNDYNVKSNYKNLYDLNNYIQVDTSGLAYNPMFEGTASSPYLGNMENSNSMYGLNLDYKGFKISYFSLNRKAYSAIGKLPFYSSYQLPNTFWGEKINQFRVSYDYFSTDFHSQTNVSYLTYRVNNGSSELTVNPMINKNQGLNFAYGASDEINIDQLFNFELSKKTVLSLGANLIYAGNLPISQSLSRPLDKDFYTPFSEKVAPNEYGYYILSNLELATLGNIYRVKYIDYQPITYSVLGLFGQLDMSFDKLYLLFDLRYDKDSRYNNVFSPRISARYNFSKSFGIKASISESYKSPNSYYKYSSFSTKVNSFTYIPFPNTKLDNEKLRALSFGVNYTPNSNNNFALIGNYYHRYNEIVFSFSNPDLVKVGVDKYGYYGYVNNKGHGSHNVNFQAIANLKNIIESIKFDLDISVSYQNSTVEHNPELLMYDTYRIQPKFIYKLNSKVNLIDKFDLIASFYANSSYNNSYYDFYKITFPNQDISNILTNENNFSFWSDLGINYNNNNFSFFAKIYNLLDSKYHGIQSVDPLTGLYYNPQPGRIINFGIKFRMQ